ncbi:hypothetical protein ZWY2020_025035 [Hordeum vulgare]|nr:hypothetical protein ZWY2020_025035 [Hordeum vulgare]
MAASASTDPTLDGRYADRLERTAVAAPATAARQRRWTPVAAGHLTRATIGRWPEARAAQVGRRAHGASFTAAVYVRRAATGSKNTAGKFFRDFKRSMAKMGAVSACSPITKGTSGPSATLSTECTLGSKH